MSKKSKNGTRHAQLSRYINEYVNSIEIDRDFTAWSVTQWIKTNKGPGTTPSSYEVAHQLQNRTDITAVRKNQNIYRQVRAAESSMGES